MVTKPRGVRRNTQISNLSIIRYRVDLKVPIDMQYVIISWSTHVCRAMPIVLPHKLLPWLARNGLWPEVNLEELREYWNHHKEHDTGIKAPSDEHHPVYLWGDDVRYGKRFNQKVMVCVVGHVLDKNRNSYLSCHPRFGCVESTLV